MAQTGREWRPLTERDLPAWARLIGAIAVVDGAVEHLGEDDLRDELTASWHRPELDTWVTEDDAGEALAFGHVDLRPSDTTLLRVRCWGGVRPDQRGRGLGRAVLARQLTRTRELVADRRAVLGDPTVAARAMVSVLQGDVSTGPLLARSGFAVARWSCVMRRDLSAPVPSVPDPGWASIRPFEPAWDDAVREVHNQAFARHWGSQPLSPQTWSQLVTLGKRDFRPEWSLVAFDRLGVAGYLLSDAYRSEWEALGYTQGFVSLVGVRPDRQRQGLGAALLTHAMRVYREAGMEYAGLDVDAENTTGAVAVYARLGFEILERTAQWTLEV